MTDAKKTRKPRGPAKVVRPLHIDTIKEKCTIEGCGCWTWTGQVAAQKNGKKFPQESKSWTKHHNLGTRTVRRIALYLKTRKSIPVSLRVITTCGNELCVNPAHLKAVTCGEIAKILIAQGRIHNAAAQAKTAINGIGYRKLTMEQAREVQLSDETAKDAAQRLGVSKQIILKIRRGESYKEAGMTASPWAGLGQRKPWKARG